MTTSKTIRLELLGLLLIELPKQDDDIKLRDRYFDVYNKEQGWLGSRRLNGIELKEINDRYNKEHNTRRVFVD